MAYSSVLRALQEISILRIQFEHPTGCTNLHDLELPVKPDSRNHLIVGSVVFQRNHMSNLSVTPKLVDQLFELPIHLRGKTLLAAASFRQRSSFGPEKDIELIRESFATYWEDRYTVGISFQAMRELLDPPIPVSHILGFCRLNYCATKTDLSTELANLADDLNREISKSQSPKQDCLFSKGDDEFEKHIKKSPFSGKSVDDLNQLAESDCKFPTIYADPPWMYDNRSSRGAAENHYPTMPVDKICKLPISELSDDNAHLHLWTTNAFLRD